jgi:hypothetical protein
MQKAMRRREKARERHVPIPNQMKRVPSRRLRRFVLPTTKKFQWNLMTVKRQYLVPRAR